MIFNLTWMEDIVSSTVARPRMYATLLGLFAAIGLTVALLGIYSVMAYNVSQRTREIGIRMALGARPALVLADVLRRALMLTTLGVAIGLLGATAVTSVLKSLLFGLTPLDVTTFTGVACLVTMAAALAAAVPARAPAASTRSRQCVRNRGFADDRHHHEPVLPDAVLRDEAVAVLAAAAGDMRNRLERDVDVRLRVVGAEAEAHHARTAAPQRVGRGSRAQTVGHRFAQQTRDIGLRTETAAAHADAVPRSPAPRR